MTEDIGRSPSGRATHERSRVAPSPPSRVCVPNAVAFLDFDGVISSFRAWEARHDWIDPIACEMLGKLQSKHGFKIVISSSWRDMGDRAKRAIKPYGLCDHLHEDWKTNRSPTGHRGEEVDDWLRRNGNPEFIIFDDETDFHEGQFARLIQCDMYDGMLHRHFVAADELLTRILASGTEAGTAETAGLSPEGDGPTPQSGETPSTHNQGISNGQ